MGRHEKTNALAPHLKTPCKNIHFRISNVLKTLKIIPVLSRPVRKSLIHQLNK